MPAIPLHAVTKALNAGKLPYHPWPAAGTIPELLQNLEQLRFSGRLRRDELLQFLVRLQQEFGWIHPVAIDWCAANLSEQGTPLSTTEIRGIIDFYSFLEHSPCPGFHLYLSTNVTDFFRGQQGNLEFFRALQQRYPDRFRVTTTSCTGLCDQGPGALLNGHPVPALDAACRQAIKDLVEGNINPDSFIQSIAPLQDNVHLQDQLLSTDIPPGIAVKATLTHSRDDLMNQIERSQLRGRGGAGFSTAFKWQSCRNTPGTSRVVICNADEGEPGTFKDRVLLSRHLDQVLDGMTIAAYAIGADRGYIYLRHEYQFLLPHLTDHISYRYQQNLLGADILGRQGFCFDLQIHLGAGAYICGEESALIESMEGKRGIPRIRPPYPAQQGYLGLPTVVNNVETFCCVTQVALHGGDAFARKSHQGSTGTKVHSISGDCARPGIYELPFDATIADALQLAGAGKTQAVQVGGPSGKLIFPRHFDRALNFSEVSSGGSFMVFHESRDLFAIVKNFTDFFHHESCGFCTPCRVGCGILSDKLEKFAHTHADDDDILHLQETMELMDVASHCGLGQTAAHPVRFLLQEKPEFFSARKSRDATLKIELKEHTSAARALSAVPEKTGATDDR